MYSWELDELISFIDKYLNRLMYCSFDTHQMIQF